MNSVTKLNKTVFPRGKPSFVSIGRIRADIIELLKEKRPELGDILSAGEDILFWADRIKHTEKHIKDFISENEYNLCFEHIPEIIKKPDYVSVHPNNDSISFIRKYSDTVSVAIRISASGKLSYRTMYPLRQSQLDKYISEGRAWKL